MIPATSSVVLGSGGVRPTLDLNFASARTLDPRIDFTRATSATYFDETGTLQTAASGAARFDFDPATKSCRGLLIEEARTNSIRNSTMVGAVAGTPGTVPTNWAITSSFNGLSTSIVGTGVSGGINYIDVRINGTATSSNTPNVIYAEGNKAVAASNGQTWASSMYVAVVGGSTANINQFFINHRYNDTNGSLLTYSSTILTSLSSTLQRYSVVATASNASTAYVTAPIAIDFTNGAAIDITLRIGLPQLEQGAFATSAIPTSTVAVTRNADVAVMTGANFSSWYNQTEGTFLVKANAVNNISGSTRRFIDVNDSTSVERIIFGHNATTSTRMLVTTASVNQADVQVSTGVATGSNVAMAGTYKLNYFQQASNGTLGPQDTSGSLPVVSQVNLGCDSVQTAATTLNGWISRLTYYPKRLPDDVLQRLAT